MEVTVNYSSEEFIRNEIQTFVNEGLQDMYNGNLLDFDQTFDELEERYSAND